MPGYANLLTGEQLCLRLGCVIVDEIHYIGDPKRGPTLESVITKLRSLKSSLKIVGLSATIANANDILQGACENETQTKKI